MVTLMPAPSLWPGPGLGQCHPTLRMHLVFPVVQTQPTLPGKELALATVTPQPGPVLHVPMARPTAVTVQSNRCGRGSQAIPAPSHCSAHSCLYWTRSNWLMIMKRSHVANSCKLPAPDRQHSGQTHWPRYCGNMSVSIFSPCWD